MYIHILVYTHTSIFQYFAMVYIGNLNKRLFIEWNFLINKRITNGYYFIPYKTPRFKIPNILKTLQVAYGVWVQKKIFVVHKIINLRKMKHNIIIHVLDILALDCYRYMLNVKWLLLVLFHCKLRRILCTFIWIF